MSEKVYLHPAVVRVWHWLNGAGFVILVITGLQIRFAEMIRFLSVKDAVTLHNFVGFVVIADYLLWYGYYFWTGRIGVYYPKLSTVIDDAVRQAKYYGYGVFRGATDPHVPTPEHKFNALQQLTYLILMFVCLPAQIITGLFLWKVNDFSNYIELLGGIRIIDTIHVLLFYFFIAFMLVHCYLSTLGRTPGAHYRAMFTGFEEHD